MYSVSVRLNTMVFFTIIVLGIASLGNILTTFHLYKPDKSQVKFSVQRIELNKFEKKNHKNKLNQEQVLFTFDLNADMRQFFNWNVKQLFVYLSVDFNQGKNMAKEINPNNKYLTESIIWDKIITRAEIHKQQIVETKTPIEYSLRDLYRNLKGQQVKINLWVEVMPIVGYIYRDKVASFNYTLPNEYVNEKYK